MNTNKNLKPLPKEHDAFINRDISIITHLRQSMKEKLPAEHNVASQASIHEKILLGTLC